uniref:Uncharacterized protein n=1 Tax=Setaria italica TaxID=4555 RepID=K4AH94_SETIT
MRSSDHGGFGPRGGMGGGLVNDLRCGCPRWRKATGSRCLKRCLEGKTSAWHEGDGREEPCASCDHEFGMWLAWYEVADRSASLKRPAWR